MTRAPSIHSHVPNDSSSPPPKVRLEIIMNSSKKITCVALSLLAGSLLVFAAPSEARADDGASPATTSAAQEPDAVIPEKKLISSRFIGEAEAAGRVNPSVVEVSAGLFYRYVISRDEARLREKHYIQAGAGLSVQSAYAAPSVHVEWSPLPPLKLRAEYQMLGFTGEGRGLIALPSKDSPFGEHVLDHAPRASGIAHKAALSNKFNMQFWRIALRGRNELAFYHFNPTDSYFYDVQHDTVVKRNDVVMNGRTEVLFEAWRGGREASLYIGPHYEMTRAIRTDIARQRVGGGFTFIPVDSAGPMYRPAIYADVGGNVDDTNRQGEAYASFGIRTELQ